MLRSAQVEAPPPRFDGELLLGGATRVFAPLVSPDAQTLAFLALVKGVAQVAVMKPGSGDWVVLTKRRDLGSVNRMDWARDGTRIYFDRVSDIPAGVFSIPVLGGDERLVLPGAQGPEALPDGSLLAVKVDSDRNFQLQRFWPESGRL
ncbi:MAG TPA: serine/threonine protein kinase, partial [Thermoanaerobaculia bacterium]|nr:serine/threonine protein kinase [Thermoanaerobaculia bacterium]